MRGTQGGIRVFNAHDQKRVAAWRLARLVKFVVSREQATWRGEVNVVLCDDQTIRELNARFLGHDYPTDVLAFPLGESPAALEGEVYVSLDRAEEQAREAGVSFDNEVCRLVAHGLLHLLGYRDGEAVEAAKMQARQEGYLRLFLASQGATKTQDRTGGC